MHAAFGLALGYSGNSAVDDTPNQQHHPSFLVRKHALVTALWASLVSGIYWHEHAQKLMLSHTKESCAVCMYACRDPSPTQPKDCTSTPEVTFAPRHSAGEIGAILLNHSRGSSAKAAGQA